MIAQGMQSPALYIPLPASQAILQQPDSSFVSDPTIDRDYSPSTPPPNIILMHDHQLQLPVIPNIHVRVTRPTSTRESVSGLQLTLPSLKHIVIQGNEPIAAREKSSFVGEAA